MLFPWATYVDNSYVSVLDFIGANVTRKCAVYIVSLCYTCVMSLQEYTADILARANDDGDWLQLELLCVMLHSVATTSKPTPSFLQAGCPCCCPSRALKETYPALHSKEFLTPSSPGVLPTLSLMGDGQLITVIFLWWVDWAFTGPLWRVDFKRKRDRTLVV